MTHTVRCAVVVTVLAGAAPVAAERPATIPVSQIHPGQTGYGLTVFSGFKVERFDVRVIDVLKNFLPKQDIILIKVDHPRLRKTNVLAGMSGSPIFIRGKLAGALAYGWRFSKEPIAGVTPIANMLALLQRQLRGPPRTPATARYRRRRAVDRLTIASLARRDRWWRRSLPRPLRGGQRATMLEPVSVPLNIAGFSPAAVQSLRREFGAIGFEPVQGGGTGRAEGPRRFEPGGAIGIQLVDGEMSMVGTGTVTWTDKRNVLGFGHAAFNAGEIYLPVVSARINHTLASLARSFKLSSPARVLGALVQDRQAAIHAQLGREVGLMPLVVTMRAGGRQQVFRARIARHELLTATLARNVVASALGQAMTDVEHATFAVKTRIVARGLPEIAIDEQLYSPVGVRQVAVFASRGIAAVGHLVNNPFRPLELERVDVAIDVKYDQRPLEIVAVQVGSSVVEPGAHLNLGVRFRPYDGPELTKTYPLVIPETLAGTVVKVQVTAGLATKPDLAPPEDLEQYIRNLTTIYPGRSLVVSLYTPTEGIMISGEVLRDLPESVLDALQTGAKAETAKIYKPADRVVFTTRELIAGKQEIRIRVKAEGEE